MAPTQSLSVQFYGTRGSFPESGAEYTEFGGHTTCLRVHSSCIPSGVGLVIDAGSGYRQCSKDLLSQGVMNVALLFTHYHLDHIMGLSFAPHTFVPGCHTRMIGPVEQGKSPKKVVGTNLMAQPVHPIDFAKQAHLFSEKAFDPIGTHVILVHPVGGFMLMKVDAFRRKERDNEQVHFPNNHYGSKGHYDIAQCMVIWMYKTVHPEYTVSYRIEERPSGKVFVFLTDHENTAGFGSDFLAHLRNADLLVQDAQYNHEEYLARYVTWGHGTPVYCAQTMVASGAKRLGLTHHDPDATDNDVRQRVEEARIWLADSNHSDLVDHVFACGDGMIIEV